MAVEVSQEWKNNQKAIVRKRGFVNIELGSDNTKYTTGYTVERQSGAQSDDYFYISDSVMSSLQSAETPPKLIFTFTEAVYRTIYLELETSSTKSNVNYENTITINTQSIEHYSDNSTIISFPIPEGCVSYQMCITKWFNDNEIVKIKSVSFGKNITIPIDRIKSCVHSRSYDPMSFELPTNSIQIDLFNYDDFYTPFYEDYTNERIKICVKYGYVFETGAEIIQGGIFYTKDVQNEDDILTITGDCSLTLIDDDGSYTPTENTLVYQQYPAQKSELMYYDMDGDIPNVKFGTILADIKSAWNIGIIANTVYENMSSLVTSPSGKRIDTFQKTINASLQKCIINRNDVVVIEDNSSNTASGNILLLNCLEKQKLNISKKVRIVRIKAYDISNCSIANYYCKTPNNKLQSFKIENIDFSKERIHHVKTNTHGIQEITKEIADKRYTVSLDTQTADDVELWTLDIQSGFTTTDYSINETGEICDVENDVANLYKPEKVSLYFKNRKMYDITVRGDPARDVGDYVMVSLTDDNDVNTYKKGLILSSELTFDGSFKENITVRIIETEFEGTEEE